MDKKPAHDRASLLADVAEMYYLEEKNQAEIAKAIGLTRSMVSRLLTEARASGIVEIRIQRSLQSDLELEAELKESFGLKDAFVVLTSHTSGERLTRTIGKAGAQTLVRYLAPQKVLGLAWGTSISATVDAFDAPQQIPMKVVQLVGAMGARISEYDGHYLVRRMTEKLGGEAYYLNAPYLCEDAEMAQALLETKGVRETIDLARKTDVALLGIGTTSPEHSSFYLAGYVTRRELDELRSAGSVGDVGGLHFDVHGQPACNNFCGRLVSISRDDLVEIPVRLGVAGGEWKAEAILGALRGSYVNVLVIDSLAARKVLDLAAKSK
jgi:DNA-binding transcriptional regulator LsrR (DeoR family)